MLYLAAVRHLWATILGSNIKTRIIEALDVYHHWVPLFPLLGEELKSWREEEETEETVEHIYNF